MGLITLSIIPGPRPPALSEIHELVVDETGDYVTLAVEHNELVLGIPIIVKKYDYDGDLEHYRFSGVVSGTTARIFANDPSKSSYSVSRYHLVEKHGKIEIDEDFISAFLAKGDGRGYPLEK